MIPVRHYQDKTVAVFGLARSGISSARALIRGGAIVIGWDEKAEPREAALKAGIPLQDLNDVDWHDIAALILSPGVPLTHPVPHPFVVASNDTRIGIVNTRRRPHRAGGS